MGMIGSSGGDKRKRNDESDDECHFTETVGDQFKKIGDFSINSPASTPKKPRILDSQLHKDISTPSSATKEECVNEKLDFSSPVASIKHSGDDSEGSPQSTDSKSGIEFVDALQIPEGEEKPTEDKQLQKQESVKVTPEMDASTVVAYLKHMLKSTSETETAGQKTQRAATLLLLAEKISEEAQKLLAGTHHIVQFKV